MFTNFPEILPKMWIDLLCGGEVKTEGMNLDDRANLDPLDLVKDWRLRRA